MPDAKLNSFCAQKSSKGDGSSQYRSGGKRSSLGNASTWVYTRRCLLKMNVLFMGRETQCLRRCWGTTSKSLVIKADRSQGWMHRDWGVQSRRESTKFTGNISLRSIIDNSLTVAPKHLEGSLLSASA